MSYILYITSISCLGHKYGGTELGLCVEGHAFAQTEAGGGGGYFASLLTTDRSWKPLSVYYKFKLLLVCYCDQYCDS